MHIHILGICGTFMGGIALLGYRFGRQRIPTNEHPVTGAGHRVDGRLRGIAFTTTTRLCRDR